MINGKSKYLSTTLPISLRGVGVSGGVTGHVSLDSRTTRAMSGISEGDISLLDLQRDPVRIFTLVVAEGDVTANVPYIGEASLEDVLTLTFIKSSTFTISRDFPKNRMSVKITNVATDEVITGTLEYDTSYKGSLETLDVDALVDGDYLMEITPIANLTGTSIDIFLTREGGKLASDVLGYSVNITEDSLEVVTYGNMGNVATGAFLSYQGVELSWEEANSATYSPSQVLTTYTFTRTNPLVDSLITSTMADNKSLVTLYTI